VGFFNCTEFFWKKNSIDCEYQNMTLKVLRAFKIKQCHRCTNQATPVHREHARVPVAVAAWTLLQFYLTLAEQKKTSYSQQTQY